MRIVIVIDKTDFVEANKLNKFMTENNYDILTWDEQEEGDFSDH